MSGIFEEVVGARGVLVKLGLAQPESRAFVAAGLTTVVMYAAGAPKSAFTEEGELRPWKPLSADPTATNLHFLAVPLGVAVITYLFT
jgi:hypothetical protein